jgi:uncharacterized protein YndB with AHSA1/START domain
MSKKLTFIRTLKAKIEHVWDAIAEEPSLGEWLMKGAFYPVEGAKFELTEPGLIVRGQVLKVDAPHVLSYTWSAIQKTNDDDLGDAGQPSVVTWTFVYVKDAHETTDQLERAGFRQPQQEADQEPTKVLA